MKVGRNRCREPKSNFDAPDQPQPPIFPNFWICGGYSAEGNFFVRGPSDPHSCVSSTLWICLKIVRDGFSICNRIFEKTTTKVGGNQCREPKSNFCAPDQPKPLIFHFFVSEPNFRGHFLKNTVGNRKSVSNKF